MPMPPDISIMSTLVNDVVLIEKESQNLLYVITAIHPVTNMYTVINVKLKDSDPSKATEILPPTSIVKLVKSGIGATILAFKGS